MASLAGHSLSQNRSTRGTLRRLTVTGLLGATSGVAFLLLLVDALVHERARFDVCLMIEIQQFHPPHFRTFIEVFDSISNSRGAITAWLLTLVTLTLLRWWLPLLATFAMPVAGIANESVSLFLVERTRPHLPELIRRSANHEERSFPSGHVTGAVLLYGFIFVIAERIPFRPLRFAVRAICAVIIVMVGSDRVWEGAHWPSDVLGGYALGGLLLAILVALYRRSEGFDWWAALPRRWRSILPI